MDPTLFDVGLLETLRDAALKAGAAIEEIRHAGFAVEEKGDLSPVTEADRVAEAVILAALLRVYPAVAVIAEESGLCDLAQGKWPSRFFLVDPLDGTREFANGRLEFTVNIALVEDGCSVAGIVYAPATDELFEGSPLGAWRQRNGGPREPVSVRVRPERVLALASRSHRTDETNRYLGTLDLAGVVAMGSSLKFCRLAEGAADVYPCFGRTMEWDTAAGQAVLEAAGGRVLTEDGLRLRYGKRGPAGDYANSSFVASN